MFKVKPEKLQEIENAFSTLKQGDAGTARDDIAKSLSTIFGKNIGVKIVPANQSKQFFVMCVIPKESVVDKLAESILSEKSNLSTMTSLWKKCQDWTVEIDGNVLNPNFTNRELTGLLMHEVGHIIHTNSVPMRISNIIQFELANASMKEKSSLSNKMYRALVKIPIIHACTCGDGVSLKKELKADHFAMQCGYTNDLVNAMTKIENICSTRIPTESSIRGATNFAVNSLKQLQERKASIVRRNYITLRKRLGDTYMRECVDEFIKDVLVQKDEVLYESVDLVTKKEYYMEFLNVWKKKLDPVTQTQIDYIAAKMDGIKTVSDKVMLLSYLNSKIDLCEYYLGLLKDPKLAKRYVIINNEKQLRRFIEQLNVLRDRILSIRIRDDDNYVVFYPQGYEG